MLTITPKILEKIDRKIRLVVVDNFYDSIHSEWVQALLGRLIHFKIHSYQKEYPYGVLPFSSHDLVGVHLLLCEEQNNTLIPLMGYKLITHNQCKKFYLDFPPIPVVSESELHKKAVLEAIEDCHKAGTDMGYMGSWTIRPDVRKNRFLTKLCYDISSSFIAWSSFHYDIKVGLTIANLRFNIDKFHEGNGLFRMKYQGKELPDFKSKLFFEEPLCLSILYQEKISEEALKKAESYQSLWDNRLIISSHLEEALPKAA